MIQHVYQVGLRGCRGDAVESRELTQVYERTSTHLRHLTIRDAAGNEELIQTTDEHPFYVAGMGWLNAGQLQPGMRLSELDSSNDAVVVSTYRESHPDGVKVYNLEVQDDHTYFVADENGNAVWVHNFCGLSQFHHFVHRALGSLMPYKSKLLTPLVTLEHKRIHRAFRAFLVRQDIPVAQQTKERLAELFSKRERIGLGIEFYGTFRKGKYLEAHLKELGPTLLKGLFE